MQYEIVKAKTAGEALDKASIQMGDLVIASEVGANANADGTFTVRVTGLQKTFDLEQAIAWMNHTFKSPRTDVVAASNDVPTDLGINRMQSFQNILADEITEFTAHTALTEEDRITAMADTLGDVIVYCFSEARRWGIPIMEVLNFIMLSQSTKLVDGKPLWNEDGTKFIKGPNYVAPEPQIKELIEGLRNQKKVTVPATL